MENKCLRCNGTGGVVIGGSCVTCPECNGNGKTVESVTIKEGEVLPSPEELKIIKKIKNKNKNQKR